MISMQPIEYPEPPDKVFLLGYSRRCGRPPPISTTGGRGTPHWWPAGSYSRNWAWSI